MLSNREEVSISQSLRMEDFAFGKKIGQCRLFKNKNGNQLRFSISSFKTFVEFFLINFVFYITIKRNQNNFSVR